MISQNECSQLHPKGFSCPCMGYMPCQPAEHKAEPDIQTPILDFVVPEQKEGGE